MRLERKISLAHEGVVVMLIAPDAPDDIVDGVVAFAGIDMQSDTYRIVMFRVHEEYRRRGIGTRLLQEVLYSAIKEGSAIEFCVPEENLEGQLFLRKSGAIAKDEGFTPDGVEAINFILRPEWARASVGNVVDPEGE